MLLNKTKDRRIVNEVKHCRNLVSKVRGLMFRKKVNCRGLVFHFAKERVNSLHTLFVFHPIDILFLDKHKKVVEIKKNLQPFRCYRPKKKSKYVVELVAGVVRRSDTNIGDIIIW
ncbi:DUF192 domain-containing protein [Candidatus Woesearchaeota archaeon]|nr:MAG: DUF192 domain-containing protein [Candidatus Woesearchaeota archaeon]